VLAGSKIAGSAQRRHRGALLQHGSFLLQQSAASPELPGIAELTGTRIDPEELSEALARRVAARLGLRLTACQATDGECDLAARISRNKFGKDRWTCRR
jgi:lipoate-protein ligase A